MTGLEVFGGRLSIYIIDSLARIVDGSDIECDTDREACVLAEQLMQCDTEAHVWHGHRPVSLIHAPPTSMH
jgi:hypothetical protein